MVKSYTRYELAHTLGVIASHSNSEYIPPDLTTNKKGAGKVITSGLEEILIWDIKTGELTDKLRDGVVPGSLNSTTQSAPSQVNSMAFEPVSNVLAAGYSDGSIKIWDLTSSSVVMSLQGHRSAVTILKFDRSGTRLISGSRDTTAILWDLVGETGLFKLKGHRDQITGLEFLSDVDKTTDEMDDWLLTTSKDGLIKLWDLKAQQCVETHVAHSGECWSLGLNTTKELCITCGMENQAKFWKIDLSQEKTRIIEQGTFEKQSKHRGAEIGFQMTSQGEFFYIGNTDKMLELFRLRGEKEIERATTKRARRLRDKGVSEEEIARSLESSKVNMLVAPFTTLYTGRSKIRSVTWGQVSNRKLDLVVTLTNNTVTYYAVTVPEVVRRHNTGDIVAQEKYALDKLGHRHDIRAVDISDDDALMVTGSNNQLKVWNVKRRTCIRNFDKVGYVLSAKFLPGGTLVVIGTKEGHLQLLDLASSAVLDSIEDAHDGKAIWSIDLTPDGKTILTGSADKTVKFWEIKVSKELVPGSTDKFIRLLRLDHTRTLELTDDVLNVRVSPDAKYLAVALMDNTVKVFFYDTLKFYLSLYGHKLPVLSIDISFDSKTIITSSADKNIRIWGLDFGDCHRSLFGHQDSIMAVRFLPDSKNFISCSKDAMVKYWDGIKFENVQKLAAHQSEVWNLAISHSGEFFVTVSHDTSIRIWEETDDEVFIEEEREREMDETYENELLGSLEGGAGDEILTEKDKESEEDDAGEVGRVSKQTMEKLKAGEKLMEALDAGWKQVEESNEYEKQILAFKHGKIASKPIKPAEDPLLAALHLTPEQYVLDTLMKIKPSQLEDGLLVFPFSYTLKLLRFIRLWTTPEGRARNGSQIPRICKALFFSIRANNFELVSQRDPEIKLEILELKGQLREILKGTCNDLGFNIAGLRCMQQQWKENHSHVFEDANETGKVDKSRKRVYTTLA
ncbi:DEKNAAC104492 [Brettanomyces naardenensis]|uniref:DEKNAAC104492 n=1 Tax=Brettanomyces naardenensis TaxID=13370 RepID=A0A448YRB5_BRENA|nr:DEKNAAC104492 [Brettanomyces naardenensis]